MVDRKAGVSDERIVARVSIFDLARANRMARTSSLVRVIVEESFVHEAIPLRLPLSPSLYQDETLGDRPQALRSWVRANDHSTPVPAGKSGLRATLVCDKLTCIGIPHCTVSRSLMHCPSPIDLTSCLHG